MAKLPLTLLVAASAPLVAWTVQIGTEFGGMIDFALAAVIALVVAMAFEVRWIVKLLDALKGDAE